MFSPMEIAAVVGVAVLIFGADKLPKLARSAGQAKKEFLVGQSEADIAAERHRNEARAAAEMQSANIASTPNGMGGASLTPDPLTGTAGPTTIARPQQD
jgi:sec-independent protein translocase protein TatA